MQGDATNPDLFELHAGFLRRLAKQLVTDEHDSEDLVQETWAVFAEKNQRGQRPRNLRGWLATVIRNRANNFRRDRAARRDRETQTFDESSRADSTARDLAVQERVLAAVTALREPFRGAIYMRYYQGLTPTAIAAELKVPVATIDSRLLRGRALIREQLNVEFGDNRVWLSALIPLCPPNLFLPPVQLPPVELPVGHLPVGPIASVGALGMKLVLAIVASITVISAALWTTLDDGEAGDSEPIPAVHAETLAMELPSELETIEPLVAELTPSSRKPTTSTSSTDESEELAAAVPATLGLGGLVLDLDEWPVPSLQLRFQPTPSSGGFGPEVSTQSNGSGEFEFEGLFGAGRVYADEPGWTTVFEGALARETLPGERAETSVVVARSREVRLRVQDEEGLGIDGALVRVVFPPSLHKRTENTFERSALVQIEDVTSSSGSTSLVMPSVAGIHLRVQKFGFEDLVFDFDASAAATANEAEIVLTMVHLSQRDQTLSGRVVDLYGTPIPGACVELGRLGTRCDEEGRFHFDLSKRDPFASFNEGERYVPRLTAVHSGWRAATLEAALDADGEPDWPDDIVLQLIERPLSISGRVIDENGAPIEGALVFVPKLSLIAGRTTIEAEMRGQDEDGEFLITERTDASGRFEFGGLLDKPYTIAAFLEDSLVRGQVEHVAAGEEQVVIRLDRTAIWPEVRGRVVNRDGIPLAGLKLTPGMASQSAAGTTGDWNTSEDMEPVTTDDDGRFVLLNIPKRFMRVDIVHPETLFAHKELNAEGAREDERGNLIDRNFEVGLRMRFHVQLDQPTEADAIRVLDADGEEIEALTQTANSYFTSPRNQLLHDGLSGHLFVGEDAREMVLLKDGAEVRRIPLDLKWLEETVIR